MSKVRPHGNESIQQTLRRFRKLLEKEGIIKDMKRRTYYESPSEERSRRKRKQEREREKELRKTK
jgi:small subunit ribosomal protein S21